MVDDYGNPVKAELIKTKNRNYVSISIFGRVLCFQTGDGSTEATQKCVDEWSEFLAEAWKSVIDTSADSFVFFLNTLVEDGVPCELIEKNTARMREMIKAGLEEARDVKN